MLVMGIESSCDDTSVAIVSENGDILSNVISSQIDIHRKYGGVVPEIAARAHLEYIDSTFEASLKEADVAVDDIDAVAATCGPGLIGGVIVGSVFAKTFAATYEKPFFAINHLVGHALSARLENKSIEFPYLLFLMSGGHCMICIVKGGNDFTILGKTLDDSVGETFDKVAKMLDLRYPGGPEIQKLAELGDNHSFDLPRPLYKKQGCDMSFSGLKTAVRNLIESIGKIDTQIKADICASFQQVICDVLSQKIEYAIQVCKENNIAIKGVVIGGGVAANKFIRAYLKDVVEKYNLNFFAPSIKLCTDNAAMIAWVAIERIIAGGKDDSLDFKPIPRWPIDKK